MPRTFAREQSKQFRSHGSDRPHCDAAEPGEIEAQMETVPGIKHADESADPRRVLNLKVFPTPPAFFTGMRKSQQSASCTPLLASLERVGLRSHNACSDTLRSRK